VDGKSHDCRLLGDAFKVPGRSPSKSSAKRAQPVAARARVLVEVVTPEDFLCPVVRDLNRRRGHVNSQDNPECAGFSAPWPLAEMFGYATDLRSTTQGRATYTMHFEKYEEVPAKIAEEVNRRPSGHPRAGPSPPSELDFQVRAPNPGTKHTSRGATPQWRKIIRRDKPH